MVICSYYLNNNCRFGNRCVNEHLNVRLTLKTDAEASVGKQWPLSSYGPFRDKPCIPDFIEDQSFEEVRFLCYEAKAAGNVQTITQQFTERVNNARNKMALLINPSDDIVKMVINLYNDNCIGSTNSNMAANQNTTSNPFGMNSNLNTINAASIFGGSNATPTVTNNLFSSSITSTNPFAKNASDFGAPTHTQTSNNLFAGSSFSSNTNTVASASIFGGSQTTSAFGSNAALGPFSQVSNSSPFALPKANISSMGSSLFQNNTRNATFGGTPTFGTSKTGIFAQASVSLGQQSSNAGNIFGQNVQPQGFGSMITATTQSQSIFGAQNQAQPNAFGSIGQSTQANSIFGGNSQQQIQQPQPTLFQNTTNAFGGSNTFANPIQNQQTAQSVFGNAKTQTLGFNQTSSAPLTQTVQQPSQQQQSIFGSSTFANPAYSTASLFSKPQEQPVQQQQNTQSMFGTAVQNELAAKTQHSSTIFTPMEALSADEIEAFRSDSFDIKRIPTKPPPIELCR